MTSTECRVTDLCHEADVVLTVIGDDRSEGALWMLDRAAQVADELRNRTQEMARELSAPDGECSQEAATVVVRSVRLQRRLTDAMDTLTTYLRESLFLITRVLRRPRPLTEAMASACEHFSGLTGGAPVMCTVLSDSAETVLAAYPQQPDDDAETLHVDIPGTSGILGRLYVAVTVSHRPVPMVTSYMDTLGQVLGLALSGVLHDDALVRRVEWLERELQQVRAAISGQRVTDESLLGLTEREQEVLALLRHGESNAVIAQRLYVSVETVKTHVKNVLRKLGSANRNELITRATPPDLRREGQFRE